MINRLSWSITNLFIGKNEIPEEDGEIYAFGFECILANVIQIALLTIVGFVLNCLIEIALYSVAFTRIKGHIGGYHANSHFTCISGYTVVAFVLINLSEIIPQWTSLVFVLIALILIFLFAPIQHANNPKTDDEVIQARKSALTHALIISSCIFGLYISPLSKFAIYSAVGFFSASVSLVIPNRE